ncbi:MAG: alpha/beta hydrolase, partial [Boseongicola sp.]|nr:alpha/beta hydrolase [Boseongicola sp.]
PEDDMARPIGFIHSALADASAWDGLIAALDMDIEPVRIELPGHGAADNWDLTRDYSDQALEIALDALPPEPVPLVGHSLGAVIALRLAVEKFYRVSSLVMIEPVFFAAMKGTDVGDKAARDMAPYRRKLQEGSDAMAARAFVTMWGNGTPWDEMPEARRRYIVDRIGLVEAANDLLWEDRPGLLRPGRLEEIEVPVTLVEGGKTHPVVPAIIDALGRRIPNAEGITVPGAAHMVSVTHPKVVAEAIRARLVWDGDGVA